MAQLFKNAARSALAAPIAAADTSLTVDITTADLFPAANTGTDPVGTVGKDWFKVVLEDVNHNIEIVYVRTRTLGSAVMSNLQRGQEGTTAISFATGSVVGLRMTASDMQDAINLAAQATTYGEDLLWAASVDAQVTKLGSALQKQLVQAFTTAGTSTAYTITPTPAITAYAANLSFDVTFNQTCGLNPTLSISGVLTPPNLVKQNPDGTYSNLAAGDVVANHRSRVTLLSATQALVEKLPPKFSAASADIASAATLDLTAVTGEIVRVTGTTATTAVTMNNGQRVKCIAVGAWPLTYHATNLPVQGGASYTCSAGDMIIFTKNGNGDLTIEVIPKNGTILGLLPKANGGTGSTTGPILRGHIDGLKLSPAGASATMPIGAGEATDSTAAVMMTLAAAINKTTAAWAVGNNQGGLDTGTIANSTWYDFYEIMRPDTGVVDVAFCVSGNALTLPANYTYKRIIGSGLTSEIGQWVKIVQKGNKFAFDTPVLDFSGAGSATAALLTCSAPRGRKVNLFLSVVVAIGGGADGGTYISDPDISDLAPSVTVAPLASVVIYGSLAGDKAGAQVSCWTDTSARVRHRELNTQPLYIATLGWEDLRGKDA